MSKVYDLIERLAATSKHTEKEAILRSVVGTDIEETVKKVFSYTYDESINFWLREFPFPETFTEHFPTDHMFKNLDLFSSRELTGNAAMKHANDVAKMLSYKDAVIFDRILKRDLRCATTDSLANKIWPGLIETFPYQRCSSFNEKNLRRMKFPCFSQVKADGLYIDIIVRVDHVRYQTRTGKKLLINDVNRDAALLTGKEYVLQGEALILDFDSPTGYMSRKEGNGILNSDEININDVAFVLWDCLSYNAWKGKETSLTYEERLASLSSVVSYLDDDNVKIVDTIVVNSVQEIIDHFKLNVERGEEGSVVKNFKAIWKDGTSPDQVKVKIEFVCELVVIGYKEGEGRNKGRLGAFLCASQCGLLEVNVGTGYKDSERIKMWKNRDAYIGQIFAVKSNDVIQNRNTPEKWSLFLPRSVEERSDKTVADTYERILEQRDAFVDTLKVIGT
jgi:DNA ligase-1